MANEKAGVPFLFAAAKRCSNPDHIVWDVTYRDGTPDRLHQGLWPNSLNPRQRQQLDEAAQRLQKREERQGQQPFSPAQERAR